VIHVGANTGQEREYYRKLGLRVLWIEPIPRVFEELKLNLVEFPKQQAIQALVTDKDNETYDFHVANNNGASSSILEIKECRDIWPSIDFEGSISLNSTTLTSLLLDQNIDISLYDSLVMDTQGTELLVLKGGESILKHFHYVKTEVADFESYAGCCRLDDIKEFMRMHDFHEFSRHAFAHRCKGGAYYDVVYMRNV
jgi:FkbM family methyltransferase